MRGVTLAQFIHIVPKSHALTRKSARLGVQVCYSSALAFWRPSYECKLVKNFLESNLAIQIKFNVIPITYNSISAIQTWYKGAVHSNKIGNNINCSLIGYWMFKLCNNHRWDKYAANKMVYIPIYWHGKILILNFLRQQKQYVWLSFCSKLIHRKYIRKEIHMLTVAPTVKQGSTFLSLFFFLHLGSLKGWLQFRKVNFHDRWSLEQCQLTHTHQPCLPQQRHKTTHLTEFLWEDDVVGPQSGSPASTHQCHRSF